MTLLLAPFLQGFGLALILAVVAIFFIVRNNKSSVTKDINKLP